jgi:MFS family permease
MEATNDLEKQLSQENSSNEIQDILHDDVPEPLGETPLGHKVSRTTTTQTLSPTYANTLVIFVVLAQLINMIPFGAGINAGFGIPEKLGVDESLGSWIAAAYPLTSGSFVLIGGTLGAKFGHRNVLAFGAAWWIVFNLATGIMDEFIGFCIMRGLAGIGGGLITPNGVALLGITFPIGTRRNLAMALFGAMAPVGAAGGSLIAGVFFQEVQWKWFFLFL